VGRTRLEVTVYNTGSVSSVPSSVPCWPSLPLSKAGLSPPGLGEPEPQGAVGTPDLNQSPSPPGCAAVVTQLPRSGSASLCHRAITPGFILPQGLCTGCTLCLQCSPCPLSSSPPSRLRPPVPSCPHNLVYSDSSQHFAPEAPSLSFFLFSLLSYRSLVSG
jgi:hypothetical protein